MPLFPSAPVRVQPFFGFRNENRLSLSARALRAGEPDFERRGFFSDLKTMLRQYASHEVASLPVSLDITAPDGKVRRHEAVTDKEGFVHFEIDFEQPIKLKDQTRWERAHLRWQDETGSARSTSAHVLAPGLQARTGIISDIDDTILETGITGDFRAVMRNWRRILLQMPAQRMVVPGAREFYETLGGKAGKKPESVEPPDPRTPIARVRPTFYVSSSPWNLFSYLVTFKQLQDLPLGPVMLRDWGLNRRTLGSKSHGSHKREAIARILDRCPHLRFVLVGDNTQKDPVAFGDIVSAYCGRIAGVFIRSVEGVDLRPEARAAQAAIKDAGVPFWNGSDYIEAAQFAREHGLDYSSSVPDIHRA